MATYIPQKDEDSASASGDKGVPILAVRNDNDAASTNNDGDYAFIAVDSAGRLKLSHTATSGGTLPTRAVLICGSDGVNARFLKTDSGGAIQVDIESIAAGAAAIGDVGVIPRTTGGYTTFHLVSAATTNATNIKASAGQLFGWYIYNSNAAARKLALHNTSGTPTAGAGIFFSLVIPPSSGANVFSATGIAFSSGIGITTVTGLADSDATGVAANDLIINLFYV